MAAVTFLFAKRNVLSLARIRTGRFPAADDDKSNFVRPLSKQVLMAAARAGEVYRVVQEDLLLSKANERARSSCCCMVGACDIEGFNDNVFTFACFCTKFICTGHSQLLLY